MLDSFFFVPGDNLRFINKISTLDADKYVIDLEESVSNSNKYIAYNLVKDLDINNNTFVRIPFFDNSYKDNEIAFLINKFEGRVLVPKIETENDFEKVIAYTANALRSSFIILVENALCFLNIYDILKHYNKFVYGIGFGSHDFCASMGMTHRFKLLKHYRQSLLVLSKAYGLKYIDGVDTNISDFKTFKKECLFAFEAGADGKFLIHPNQLQKMNEIEFLSEFEIKKNLKVYEELSIIDINKVDVLTIDGEIYEKPHLLRIEKLMNKLINKGKIDI